MTEFSKVLCKVTAFSKLYQDYYDLQNFQD
jgi:hypothetical protein